MSDIKWIKISTRIFDDEKFDAIRAMVTTSNSHGLNSCVWQASVTRTVF